MATYTDYCNSGGKASRYALQLVIDLIPQTDLDKQNNLTRANLNLILAGAKYFGLPVDYVGSSFNGYTCYGTITIQNARTNTDLYVGQGSASGTVSSTSAISICSASEVPLPHNGDGTLTLNVSGVFTGGLSSQASGGRVAGTLPVPTIARATTLTDQTLYVGKSDNVVALSPMDASFHHILSFNCGGRYFEARGNDRITFDLNDDSIYNLFAGASERVVGYLATYSNFNYSTQIGETKSANITIATQEHLCKPVITYQNNVDVNETTKALSDKYVDGYSDCKIEIGCETPHSEISHILLNGQIVPFQIDVKGSGKNILPTDWSYWEKGQYDGSGNKVNNANRVRLINLIDVEPNTTYYFSTNSNDLYTYIIRSYDNNGTFVKSIGTKDDSTTYTTGTNEYKLGITIGIKASGSSNDFEILFKNGSIKPFICLNSEPNKTFEPYGASQNKLIDMGNLSHTSNVSYTFGNNILSISSNGGTYSSVRYDLLDIVKNNPGKRLYFKCDSYDFSNGNKAIVQINTRNNGSMLYNSLMNNSGTFNSYLIPSDVSGITECNIHFYTNNTSTNGSYSATWVNPVLSFSQNPSEENHYYYIIDGVTRANNEIKVISKRGYSSEIKQINLQMLGYINPTFTKGDFSRNTPTDGILKLDYSGRAFTGDFKSGANAFTINLDWVEGENNGTIPLTEATIGDGQFSQTINLSDEDKDLFNYQKNYQFTLRITDTLRSQLGLTDVIITGAITKGIPIWWWDDLSFNVEGDLKIDGKSMFDLIYPVGSIYMSIDSTNPKILFGGEWQQIKGRFLLGTGTPDANSDNYFGGLSGRTWNAGAGSTGGEDFHTLTVAEMPSHRHEGIKWFGEQNISLNSTGGYGGYGLTGWSQQIPESYSPLYTAYTGGNSAFAKMPPYFAVYIWQRVG